MTGDILQFEDLQRLYRPEGPPARVSTVRRWAEKQEIPYKYDGNGGIWTTMAAVNAALNVVEKSARPEDLI